MVTFRMQHQEFEPLSALKDTIQCFWHHVTDPGDFEVMPDGYAEIIFHFGSSCSISHNGILQPLPSPFMMGLLNQPVVVHTQQPLEIIGIRCFPWTVFDLLELPSEKAGVHIFEHPIAQLQASLQEFITTGKITEALAHLEQYFLQARSRVATDSMVFKAGAAMQHAKGAIPVSQVAAAAHATVRTLERKFKQSSGYSVKDVTGLMRFEQARNQLWQYPDTNLAGLAQELGYTDQAHLSKEFRKYTGTTPAAFAKKQVRGSRLLAMIL